MLARRVRWQLLVVLLVVFFAFGLGSGGISASTGPQDDGVAVLEYHNVDPHQKPQPGVILPRALQWEIETLKARGYRFLTAQQFHAYLAGRLQLRGRAVLLTFDDGYEGVYTYAFPILEKERVPALVFPIMKWFTPGAGRPPYSSHLTRAEARTMLASGWVSFGGHSYNGHDPVLISANGREGPFWTSLAWLPSGRTETEVEYEARLWHDAVLMTGELHAIGVDQPVDFAWPGGHFSAPARQILQLAGYRYFYTGVFGVNRPGQDPAVIYRVYASNNAAVLVVQLDKAFARQRSGPRSYDAPETLVLVPEPPDGDTEKAPPLGQRDPLSRGLVVFDPDLVPAAAGSIRVVRFPGVVGPLQLPAMGF